MTDVPVELRMELDGLVEPALATHRPDWADVVSRVQRQRPSRKSVFLIAATVAAIVSGSALALGPDLWQAIRGTSIDDRVLSERDLRALRTVSSGRPVGISKTERRQLRARAGRIVSIQLVGTRFGRSLYLLTVINEDGERVACQASGPAEATDRFGFIRCSAPDAPAFPSPERPVLDQSVIEVSREDASPHVVRLEGLAADAVKSVALTEETGSILARTPVIDNVYVRTTGLPRGPVSRIVALDQRGETIWTMRVTRGG